jgi:hypothetical protein
MPIAFLEIPLVKKAKTAQVLFTLEGEGLRTQIYYHGWKVYMDAYMAYYK